MSGNRTKRIDARALKAQLHDGGELALLDAREELLFGRRHLLMASFVPLSRLERWSTIWCRGAVHASSGAMMVRG